ncbi:hypothetical protein NLI96_g12779 [Meripilus lineatus]|uniref:Uncharacterized protein n=1 Tax=Meripilus lineatus TaxID=2056292 RepID=A0AAD5UQZ4_9APHY|nr:hypothetical protein NLI96_g12779 [Physisporinus lineatus]
MGSTFNVTLDDSSPMFSYLPYGDGPVDEGWRAWYSQIGFNNDCGKESVGDSLHITSSAGASVQLTFSGTAVYLFGTANSSYEVSLDTRTTSFPPPLDNLLFSAVGLLPGTHYVNLTANPQTGQQLAFDRAIISDQTPQGCDHVRLAAKR